MPRPPSLIPRPLPDFLHSCELKSGSEATRFLQEDQPFSIFLKGVWARDYREATLSPSFSIGWSDPAECHGNELPPGTTHPSLSHQGRTGQPGAPPTAPHRDTGWMNQCWYAAGGGAKKYIEKASDWSEFCYTSRKLVSCHGN